MSELADVVIRDPFERPVEIEMPPRLRAAVAVVLAGKPRREVCIIANPITWPMSVIGSRPGRPCDKCGVATWAAPSMQAADMSEAAVACMECLERAAGMRA